MILQKTGRIKLKYDHKSRENLELLTNVMSKSGFNYINTEWWHYTDKTVINISN
jgi:D-alanyl-D-alanine dipeptidase